MTYSKDEVLADLAAVIAGLQVPMSMSMPLGKAIEPWRRLNGVTGFGWKSADEVEKALRALLELEAKT